MSLRARDRLLETLRQFAEAQLPTDALDELRRRHANWFAEFAERAYQGVATADGIGWNRRQHAEMDNMRAAAYGIDPVAARRIVAVLRGREMPTPSTRAGWLTYRFLSAAASGETDRASGALAALVEVTPSISNAWDQWTLIGLVSIFCIMIGDFDTARQIWEDNDVAERDRIPGAEAQGRFSYGRYLAAVGHPGALEQFERAAELAHELDWPSLEHVANSEMAAVLAGEGRIAAARPLLAEAIQTWVRSETRDSSGPRFTTSSTCC